MEYGIRGTEGPNSFFMHGVYQLACAVYRYRRADGLSAAAFSFSSSSDRCVSSTRNRPVTLELNASSSTPTRLPTSVEDFSESSVVESCVGMIGWLVVNPGRTSGPRVVELTQ